jgi:hypothetical protein
LANGSGRDSYINRTQGGHVKEGTFEGKPNLKVDRLFGRLQDGELMKMFKAQKGEQIQRLRELQNEKREKHRELYTTTLSPRR